MNQRIAKKIRKEIYKDFSSKSRSYTYEGGTRICTGNRSFYQQAKKDYIKARSAQ